MTTWFEPVRCSVPLEAAEVLAACPGYHLAGSVEQLADLACRDAVNGWHEVAYDVPGKGRAVEARVCRARNGIAANYPEPYMRRRDPDCLFVADASPTDKPRFQERFQRDFCAVREETFAWLKTQELAVLFFVAGAPGKGVDSMVIAPANAGFFAFGLALLQGILAEPPERFSPKSVIRSRRTATATAFQTATRFATAMTRWTRTTRRVSRRRARRAWLARRAQSCSSGCGPCTMPHRRASDRRKNRARFISPAPSDYHASTPG